MFVWMAKFGAAYGVRTGIHVGVDVLINRLNDRLRAKFIVFGLLAGALLHRHRRHAGRHLRLGERRPLRDLPGPRAGHRATCTKGPTTPDLEWPTWIVYCAVPFGSALMCFRFLQVCVGFIRTGELPHHDHGHVEGIEEVVLPEPGEEDAIFRMDDDDLHPHDEAAAPCGDGHARRGDQS